MNESEDIDEIRRRKAIELVSSLKGGDKTEEEYAKELDEIKDILPWSFRLNVSTGVTEICHHPQMRQSQDQADVVALAMDPEWADMITDMLNRAFVIHESGMNVADIAGDSDV
jgi:hypothetical protein